MTDKTDRERIEALEAELAAIRRPVPREEPQYRTLPGQTGLYDRNGNRQVADPEVDPSSTTVGGASFGLYRTDPDGTRTYAPDGVPRNQQTGEALTQVRYEDRPIGPSRTYAHQQHVEMIDRMFPITRPASEES